MRKNTLASLEDGNKTNRRIPTHTDKRVDFLLCPSCFWCASYFNFGELSVIKCPVCHNNYIEQLPVSTRWGLTEREQLCLIPIAACGTFILIVVAYTANMIGIHPSSKYGHASTNITNWLIIINLHSNTVVLASTATALHSTEITGVLGTVNKEAQVICYHQCNICGIIFDCESHKRCGLPFYGSKVRCALCTNYV
jgi:hypothetical protein